MINVAPSRPDGYLYDKEAILECLLHQKRESKYMYILCITVIVATSFTDAHYITDARKMKEYEKQSRREEVSPRLNILLP